MSTIQQSVFFEFVSPEEVYEAYMNPNKQAVYTDSECDMPQQIGGRCFMYDGYIEAVNIELVPGKLIVQQWKAYEDKWPEGHMSEIRISLEEKDGGTLLSFTHSDVPDDLKDALESGWTEYYWEPMQDYFG